VEPDFILCETPNKYYCLTPLSNFGKELIKQFEGYPTLGSALLLNQEQSFLVNGLIKQLGHSVAQRSYHHQPISTDMPAVKPSAAPTVVKDTRYKSRTRHFTSYSDNFFPNQNGSTKCLSDKELSVIQSLENYQVANPRLITASLDSFQLTPTNDYPINCSHNTGSPHTTKITREKII